MYHSIHSFLPSLYCIGTCCIANHVLRAAHAMHGFRCKQATCLALMDAGIPMRMCCAAAEAAVVDGQLVLDPTAAEEAASTATLQLAYSNKVCCKRQEGLLH